MRVTSLREVQELYDQVVAYAISALPWLASLLLGLRVVYSRSFPTTAVDTRGEIVLGEKWVKLARAGLSGDKNSLAVAMFMLLHEALHVALEHPWRIAKLAEKFSDRYKTSTVITVANVCADIIVNELLDRAGFKPPPMALTMSASWRFWFLRGVISLEDSLEEMTAKVLRVLEKQRIKLPRRLEQVSDILLRPPDDAEIVQPGMERLREAYEVGGEELIRRLREYVSTVLASLKTAGVLPRGLLREIEGLGVPKVPWYVVLRSMLSETLGRYVVSTWKRPSRKTPYAPGVKRLGLPRVWCLIDTSGSISPEELSQFMTEIHAVARTGASEILVVPWDAKSYEIQHLKRPEDVRNVKLRGGGGTVIRHVLREVLNRMTAGDVVIILTDGEIYDIEHPETRDLLERIKARASLVLCVTTMKPIPGVRNISLV